MRFNDALDRFTEWGSGQYSAKTLRVYVDYLKRLGVYLKNKEVEDLSFFKDINAYRLHLQQSGQSDSTINLSMIALRQMMKVLTGFEQELKIKLPFHWSVIPVKKGIIPRSHRPIQLEEFQKMISVVQGDSFINRRDVAILFTLYDTGVRVSELTSLNVSSIDIKEQSLTTITRKRRDANKFRKVYFTKFCTFALQRYLDVRKDYMNGEALFVSATAFSRITTRSIERVVKLYAGKAKLDPTLFKPHCFRHGWGMRAAEAEMYPPHIQANLGHTNLNGSQTYFNIKNSALKKEYHAKMGDKKIIKLDIDSLA